MQGFAIVHVACNPLALSSHNVYKRDRNATYQDSSDRQGPCEGRGCYGRRRGVGPKETEGATTIYNETGLFIVQGPRGESTCSCRMVHATPVFAAPEPMRRCVSTWDVGVKPPLKNSINSRNSCDFDRESAEVSLWKFLPQKMSHL